MADRVAEVVEFVRRSPTSESIQVGDYLRAIDNLHSMQLGFKDVQLNFFNPKLNALLNLVGLHYCIKWLQVQVCISFNSLQIPGFSFPLKFLKPLLPSFGIIYIICIT